MTIPHADPRRLAVLVAGGMCLLPFLQPRHLAPLRAFYDEWLALAFGCSALLLAALGQRQPKTALATPALFLAVFSATLCIRAVGGETAYAQSAATWALYAIFAALMLGLGHDLASAIGRDRAAKAIAGCLLAGAIANALMGVLQVAGIPAWLSSFVAHAQGTRATGNVGQANLYANYLALGAASLAFLFSRGTLSTTTASALGALIVIGSSLAASRASILYAAGFSLLVMAMTRRSAEPAMLRLRIAVLAYSGCAILGLWLVPAGMDLLGFRTEGGIVRNVALGQAIPIADEASRLRLSAWALAIQIFLDAPWFGVGPDEFPGSAFQMGLPADMAGKQLWTSPHNLILHLLCETGLSGAILVVASVAAWAFEIWRRIEESREPALWWIAACVGVELVHSLLEYPLWYAHFLAVTALLMGLGASGSIRVAAWCARGVYVAAGAFGVLLLGMVLVSYFRFDLASPAAIGRSLATDAELERERASLATLSGGLLAPRAETWLFLAHRLDDSDLPAKIAIGDRVMRLWPAREVVGRQVLFLELGGESARASALLARARANYPDLGNTFHELAAIAPPAARMRLLELAARM